MTGYDEIMAALAFYLGDGELMASEETILEVVGQEYNPLVLIGNALDDYRNHMRVSDGMD